MKMNCFVVALVALVAIASFTTITTDAKLIKGFRPRAIPLFVLNPAQAFWLKSDNLTDVAPSMWYAQDMSMTGYIRIDKVVYRWLGLDAVQGQAGAQKTNPLQQTDLTVTPTQTIATFQGAGIQLVVTFLTPAFADDLEYYARQFAYINTEVSSLDGKVHNVQLYIDQGADVPVNGAGDRMVWADWSSQISSTNPRAKVLQMNDWQAVSFQLRGDENKPNWGDVLFATDSPLLVGYSQSNATVSRGAFVNNMNVPASEILPPRNANDNWLVSAFTFDYGMIQPSGSVSSFVVFAHNELHSVDYFHNYQMPYWRHIFGTWQNLLSAAFQEYASTLKRANLYDANIIAQTTAVGGDEYATLTALIHRQVMGATVLTWNEQKQQVWGYMKEQSTDGDVSTVDVVFPASPFYIYNAPEALRVMLLPLLEYANNATYMPYNRAYAPHHLGAWPVGDILPQDQENMQMEETGNMLIMLASIAQQQGGAVDYLNNYSNLLSIWAEYLNSTLPDPFDQTCTDDFEGHIPHNANLAVKGVLGLSAYAVLMNYMNMPGEAKIWQAQAQSYALQWMVLAKDNVTTDLPHYRLRYDINGTWSIKYNLMYQYGMGVNTFPDEVRTTESTYYQSKVQAYGIPLDERHTYTKSDWQSWAGALGNSDQRQKIIHFLYVFASSSPTRQPFLDCYETTNNVGNWGLGRPVMGGLYSIAVVDRTNKMRGINFDNDVPVPTASTVRTMKKTKRS